MMDALPPESFPPAQIVTRTGGSVTRCRICGGETFTVIDLGRHPFANALADYPGQLMKTYPLALYVCASCATAQLGYCADDKELYANYTYITPESAALTQHYGRLLSYLRERGYVGGSLHVAEIGSNIGRFLEFVKPHVASILGVDPAVNISRMANERGIPTVNEFLNPVTAEVIAAEHGLRDIIVARHCFAHNEKPWLMLDGARRLLTDDGVIVIENAYFLDTVANFEFDQIYHEHMYYYLVRSISRIMNARGLQVVDLYHSPIHGGTMVYVIQRTGRGVAPQPIVAEYLRREQEMHKPTFYRRFTAQIEQNKKALRALLQELLGKGHTIHAYGASAKSTTLLNYYGITADLVPIVVDSSPTKQGKYIPLANIKVISEEEGMRSPPDYYLLTIWNYKDEVIRKVRAAGNNRTRFILPHPAVMVVEEARGAGTVVGG